MFLFQIYKDKPSILYKGKTRKFRWIPENYQIKDLKKFDKYNGIYLDTAENECAIEIWREKIGLFSATKHVRISITPDKMKSLKNAIREWLNYEQKKQ